MVSEGRRKSLLRPGSGTSLLTFECGDFSTLNMKFQKRRALTNNKSYNPLKVYETMHACVCACVCLLSQSSQIETNRRAEKLCNWLKGPVNQQVAEEKGKPRYG